MERGKLYYHGTDTEVLLGDRVTVKRIFGPAEPGEVWYLPGVSPPHPDMESEGVLDWAIRLDDGTILSWIFLPEQEQPTKRVRFIRRAVAGYVGLRADVKLE